MQLSAQPHWRLSFALPARENKPLALGVGPSAADTTVPYARPLAAAESAGAGVSVRQVKPG